MSTLGQPHSEYESEGYDRSVFVDGIPSYAAVSEARADRVSMVRDFPVTITPEDLTVPWSTPWAPERPQRTLSCLHTILEEEWQHLRYAARDLDLLDLRVTPPT